MKKLLLLIFVLCFSLSYAQTTLFVEEFNYTAGSLLTAMGYTVSSGTTNALTVTSPGLTFTNYASNAGNAVTLTSSGEDDYKTYTAVSTGSVYLAFLINVTAAQANGDYFIGMSPSTQFNYTARTFIKSNGNGFSMGIGRANETPTYGSTVYNLNATYLVVVKYTFVPLGNLDDSISLFVFQAISTGITEPATAEILNYTFSTDPTKTDAATLESVTLRQGSSSSAPSLVVDGIRIANNWGLAVTGTATDVAENNSVLPTKFDLSQNYPNPFNPSTTIKYQVPQNSFVSVNVYDVLGNEVRTLVREEKAAGSYELRFDAGNMPSGVYFYKIQAGNFTQTKKMILMK